MIDWLVNRIFRWDPLRKAIFDEVDQNAEEIILNDFALKISKVLNV